LISATNAGSSADSASPLRSVEVIQKFLTDEVFMALTVPNGSFDAPGRFALLDPDFVKVQHFGSPMIHADEAAANLYPR